LSKTILQTQQLQIGYPQKIVGKDVFLNIQKAELVAVIGINGAGKSTLLKTLTGNLASLDGEILLKSYKLEQLNPKEISALISIVLTGAEFSQNLSVEELVALGRQPYTNWVGQLSNRDRAEVKKALQVLEIEDFAKIKCSSLSDGQLQKVLLARALAQDTPLIVLDEPTTHLDLYHKVFVFKLLKNLAKKTQKAIVFASHEINLALQLCDQIILVHEGKIIQKTPKKLLEEKILEQLFPKDLVIFDSESRSFKVV
jgi:iron complex transport system ATP-binding protein